MHTSNNNNEKSEKDKVLGNNASAIEKLKAKHIEEKVAEAHEQADADIAEDPDLSIHSPNDDLDEGESARLGEDKLPI